MIKIRNSNHIRTPRMLKGFRAIGTATGVPGILRERGRLAHEESRRADRDAYFSNQYPAPRSPGRAL